MFNTIMGRIAVGFGVLAALLIAILVTTIVVTGQQKDDGLIVNLSGRQRMLTQKMTKETLVFADLANRGSATAAELDKWKTQVTATSKVFETTLFALRDGGNAPTNLAMTQFRNSPPAETAAIKAQLDTVAGLWGPFKVKIQAVLDSQGGDAAALDYLVKNNVALLGEMNKVVGQMQAQAETKVSLMVNVQGVAVAIGLLIVGVGVVVTRSKIVGPLQQLSHAAEGMSKGDLDQQVPKGGLTEIAILGSSLDRMRVSFSKMMEM